MKESIELKNAINALKDHINARSEETSDWLINFWPLQTAVSVARFKQLPSGSQRQIHAILAYHYDAILREISQVDEDYVDTINEELEDSNIALFLNALEKED